MNDVIREKIINLLKHSTVKGIGRTLNMVEVYLIIGDYNYALHVQCDFRIRRQNKIIFTSEDIYINAEKPKKGYDYNSKYGGALYDKLVNSIDLKDQKIFSVNINAVFELSIELENGIVLDVLINRNNGECWRFFKCTDKSVCQFVKGKIIIDEEEFKRKQCLDESYNHYVVAIDWDGVVNIEIE
jgi:hypothetical protein